MAFVALSMKYVRVNETSEKQEYKSEYQSLSYVVLGMVFQATCPVDPPHVCCGHLYDVQFERLLNEDEIVFCHAEAVVVAGGQERTAGHCANDLHILQCWGLFVFVWSWEWAK